MGNVRNKLEIFLRGETFLHLATMFLIQTVFVQLTVRISGHYPQMWLQLILPIIIGVGKELFDKYVDKKYISITDIVGTVIGGYMAVILLL